MSLISVDKTLCEKDGICLEVCPTGYLSAGPEGYPQESGQASCIECGHCLAVCPRGALSHANLAARDFAPVPKVKVDPEALQGLMRARRSVREFKDEAVPRPILEKLLEVGRYAPTAVNFQKTSWIVTLDPARTKRLAETTLEWMRREKLMPHLLQLADQGRDPALRGAPHLIAACVPQDYAWGVVDCTIALSYVELAAASLGLGACWAGLLTRAAQADPAVARELGLPEGLLVGGALMLGVPKYRYRQIPPRRELQAAWL